LILAPRISAKITISAKSTTARYDIKGAINNAFAKAFGGVKAPAFAVA
jgi:hypothetical protein